MFEFFEYSNWVVLRALLTGCCALLGLLASERVRDPWQRQQETSMDILVKIVFAILMGCIFAGVAQWVIQSQLGYTPCVPLYWVTAILGGYFHYNIIPYIAGIIKQIIQVLIQKLGGAPAQEPSYPGQFPPILGRSSQDKWDEDFEK